MRILVDAMGGDNAPAAAALGAIRAAEALGTEVVLVGRGEEILKALADHQIQTLPKGVEIANADDVVDMHDDPATVLKKKPQSSMVVIISAGRTVCCGEPKPAELIIVEIVPCTILNRASISSIP